MYGLGAAIGRSPQEVDEMSMWQLQVAADGWIKANGGGEGDGLSSEEKEDIWNWMEEQPAVPVSSRMVH